MLQEHGTSYERRDLKFHGLVWCGLSLLSLSTPL